MEVWVQILRKLGTNIVTVGEWGGDGGARGRGSVKKDWICKDPMLL